VERLTFDDAWALGGTPSQAAALVMRSELMVAIEQRVGDWGLTLPEAAERIGAAASELEDLLQGKWTQFSLDRLSELAWAAGINVRMLFDGPD
jgi:predicted XRE-type DNA-binding protein